MVEQTDAFIGRLPDGRYAAVSLGNIQFCLLGDSVEEVTSKAQRAVAFARPFAEREVVELAYDSPLMLEAA